MQSSSATLRPNRVRDLTYYLLLILAFFSMTDFVLREIVGALPRMGGIIGVWKEGLLFLLYIAFYLKSKAEGRVDWKASRLHVFILWTFLAAAASVIANWIMDPNTLKIIPRPYEWVPVHETVGLAIAGIRTLVEYTLFFVVINALVDDEETVKDMLHGMIVAVAIIAAYGIYQKLSGLESPKSWTYSEKESNIKLRVFSTIGNPNALGGLLVLVTPVAFALMMWVKNWGWRILYGAATLIMMACLVLTYSRGAWLGFLAAMALYTLITRNKWLALVGIAGLAAAPFVAGGVVDRLLLAFTPEYWAKASNQGRVEFWSRAIAIWKEYPIFGTGIGTVGDSVAVVKKVPGATWIDNQYLKLLAETGIVGIIPYMLMILTPIVNGFKAVFFAENRNTFLFAVNAGITSAIFGMMVENVTAAIIENQINSTTYWVLVGLLYVGIRLNKQKANA